MSVSVVVLRPTNTNFVFDGINWIRKMQYENKDQYRCLCWCEMSNARNAFVVMENFGKAKAPISLALKRKALTIKTVWFSVNFVFFCLCWIEAGVSQKLQPKVVDWESFCISAILFLPSGFVYQICLPNSSKGVSFTTREMRHVWQGDFFCSMVAMW